MERERNFYFCIIDYKAKMKTNSQQILGLECRVF
jgi:hypothetical protein